MSLNLQIGVDLGFGQIKQVTGREINKFTAVVGQPTAYEIDDDRNVPFDEEDIVIEFDGKISYVGKKAVEDTQNATLTLKPDKTDRDDDKVKYLATLGHAVRNIDPEKIKEASFAIITGLPVYEFNDLKEKLKSNMTGEFTFKYNGIQYTVNIAKVVVIPQSAGAYYSIILDENGFVRNKKIAAGKATVIDIGFRTTDIVTMKAGHYINKESFTIFTGVSNVHQEVRKLIHKHYKLVLKPTDMDKVIRERKITISGKDINISQFIDAAIQPVAQQIIDEIQLYIPDHRLIDQLILTGGGAILFGDAFTAEYGEDIMIANDEVFNEKIRLYNEEVEIHNSQNPNKRKRKDYTYLEFCNADGYYKYAKFKERKSQ